jgi:tetratricopeptide (TPR) repeat protein
MVYVWMANMGLFASQEEAFTAHEKAVRLDPLSPTTNGGYINALLVRDRIAEADQQVERYASIDPKGAMVLRGSMSSLGGNWANYILAYLEVASSGTEDLNYGGNAFIDTLWHLAALGLEEEALHMAAGDDFWIEMQLGDPEVAIATARDRLRDSPDHVGAQFDMAHALGHAGHYAEALPWLEKGWHFFGQNNLNWGYSSEMGHLAQALIAALRQAGDEAGAQRVLAEFRGYIRGYREAGIVLTQWSTSVDYLEGIGAYLAGDRESGLALIAKAAKDGYWIKPPAAFQQAMYQDPGFAPILEGQRARQAREREKVLAVVCTNNPYAAVWQPTEETCAQYMPAGRRG